MRGSTRACSARALERAADHYVNPLHTNARAPMNLFSQEMLLAFLCFCFLCSSSCPSPRPSMTVAEDQAGVVRKICTAQARVVNVRATSAVHSAKRGVCHMQLCAFSLWLPLCWHIYKPQSSWCLCTPCQYFEHCGIRGHNLVAALPLT